MFLFRKFKRFFVSRDLCLFVNICVNLLIHVSKNNQLAGMACKNRREINGHVAIRYNKKGNNESHVLHCFWRRHCWWLWSFALFLLPIHDEIHYKFWVILVSFYQKVDAIMVFLSPNSYFSWFDAWPTLLQFKKFNNT